MSPKYYTLEPWATDTDPELGTYFLPPTDSLGGIDLREDASLPGLGFFVWDSKPDDDATRAQFSSLIGTPLTQLAAGESTRQRWATKLDRGNDDWSSAETLADLLALSLTVNCAESLQMLPDSKGMLTIHLPDHPRVWARRFQGTSDEAWPGIQRRIQGIYSKVRDEGSKGLAEKYGEATRRKLGVDFDDILPDHLRGVDKPQEPTTTFFESFNTADGPTTGVDLDWTIFQGTPEIEANQLAFSSGGSHRTRADHDLSSDDMTVGVMLTAGTVGPSDFFYGGPLSRFSASADTSYRFGLIDDTFPTYQFGKFVAGIFTVITQTNSTPQAIPLYAELTSDGTTHTGFVNGNQVLQFTDSAIAGNFRAGMHVVGNDSAVRFDDFLMTDILAGNAFLVADLWDEIDGSPQLRGILRGLNPFGLPK